MVTLIPGSNSLGVDIATAEIQDNAVTPAKLQYPGFELYASGTFSAATSLFDEASLPTKKVWLLIINGQKDANTEVSIGLVFNNNTTASYERTYLYDTTLTEATGDSNAVVGKFVASRRTSHIIRICGEGDRINWTGHGYTTISGSSYNMIGGQYNNASDLNPLSRLAANTASACTGEWALYFQTDLEEAT